MISRRSALEIGKAYADSFSANERISYDSYEYKVQRQKLYDFLFQHDYEPWFLNMAKSIYYPRSLQELIMHLHTGETQFPATPSWTLEQRLQLGQRYLSDWAEDILNSSDDTLRARFAKKLIDTLQIDGYEYRNSRLLPLETDALDVQEAVGVLGTLYSELGLASRDVVEHHLDLSEEHYLAGRWDDSISNSRKYLEAVMREVARAHCLQTKSADLPDAVYDSPARVRDYLRDEGLIEAKEKDAISSVYGLLSDTSGHPYMASNDQARLLRHMALTLAQFIMLRLKGEFSARL